MHKGKNFSNWPGGVDERHGSRPLLTMCAQRLHTSENDDDASRSNRRVRENHRREEQRKKTQNSEPSGSRSSSSRQRRRRGGRGRKTPSATSARRNGTAKQNPSKPIYRIDWIGSRGFVSYACLLVPTSIMDLYGKWRRNSAAERKCLRKKK